MSHFVWSELERQFIKENAGILTDKEGARRLSQMVGRRISIYGWRKQRQMLGIKKKPGRGVCEVVDEVEAEDTLSTVEARPC